MSKRYEEIDYKKTRMGELILLRRLDPVVGVDVYEVKLGDAYLMSSLFTVAEKELARLGLAGLEGEELDVAVGGLGLGYTAVTALENPKVRSLTVVEAFPEVIEWHERGLVPEGARLSGDKRTRFVAGDFFKLVGSNGRGFDPDRDDALFHAILLDIDHSPTYLLDPSHASFYKPAGLKGLKRRLHPGGVFGMWSNDLPDDVFMKALKKAFDKVYAHVVTFPNPYQDCDSTASVYVAS